MRSVLKSAAIVLILATAGCATAPVPYCERFTAMSATGPTGPGILLDIENVKRLADTLSALNEGKCRLRPKDAT